MADVAAGEMVVVRDEEWLVRSVRQTPRDGTRLEVAGVSELVRDQSAVFYDALDTIERLDPEEVELVFDESPSFRRSRLWLESVLRRSPVPVNDTRIAVGDRGLLDRMDYQLRPAEQALSNLRPRILIGDAVGLGKTLEIGILLAELIRRGRGERILVVTPRAVLEQFQHELWTRFAIPLVRLDSQGIQRVRQTLPSSRNPFSAYKRVIISIDTLKNPARYHHHLRAQRWDVVVIDECHNLINRGTQNNALARLLADQSDALILASATPHNGKPESFAELVNLLDPTAIADHRAYVAADIEHLYVRRHRNSPDVALEVAHNWKERAEPVVLSVTPTPQEVAVLEELDRTWLHPTGPRVVARGRQLFPWTLFKAALSSPQALRESVRRRLEAPSVDEASTDVTLSGDGASERDALRCLDVLAEDAERAGPAKLAALVSVLRSAGVARNSPTRVVVFSERIPTLKWLRERLIEELRLPFVAVDVLHAQLPDEHLQAVVEAFGQASAPVRVLLASDMASEGLNLHKECHLLVHYDLPWSFIRIQQRNGRIDRYGQRQEPQITALALTSTDPRIASDLRVVTKLLQKEHAANRALGDAGVLLDVRDADIEEETVMAALQRGEDLDNVVPLPDPVALNPFAALMATGGTHAHDPAPEVAPVRTFFDDDDNFLAEALADIGEEAQGHHLDVHRDAGEDLIAFVPPKDLIARFRDLPQDYLAERKVTERLRVSANAAFAEGRLLKARTETESNWPDVHFLGPLHPVLDWAADRALARFGRNQAPVLVGEVSEPTFLTQGVWANALGQPAVAYWGAVTGLPDTPRMGDLLEAVEAAGIKERAINPGGGDADLSSLQALVHPALRAARAHLVEHRDMIETDLLARIEGYRAKLGQWQQASLFAVAPAAATTVAPESFGGASGGRGPLTTAAASAGVVRVERLVDETSQLIDALAASGEPFVRIVGVIVPRRAMGRAAQPQPELETELGQDQGHEQEAAVRV